MPQLVPFYFINQVFLAFILFVAILYIFTKYLLPANCRRFFARFYVSKI